MGHYIIEALILIKTNALATQAGNFDAHVQLSEDGIQELTWWKREVDALSNWISPPPIAHAMSCDASNFAWGVHFITTSGGSWNAYEVTLHINVKEMLAIYYSIRAFQSHLRNTHLKIYSDNSTAVSVLNKMGTSRSRTCNKVAKMVWEFCRTNCIWITCAHIPGVENVEADRESRKSYRDAEWMLNPTMFREACSFCGFSRNEN